MSASRNEGPAFCAKCGAELAPGTSFCWKCGAPVEGARVSIETKEAPKKPWYFSRPVLILTFLFLTPVWAILILADKRQEKGVKILALVIGFAYLLYCGYLGLQTPGIYAPSTYQVKYSVTGSATRGFVTYENAQGGMEQMEITIPWQKSLTVRNGQFLYISVWNLDSSGSVTCEILVDGVSWRKSTSSGAYTTAECNGVAGSD